MKLLNQRSTTAETLDSSVGMLDLPLKAATDCEPPAAPLGASAAAKATPVQIALVVLGVVVFLYFARPVVLPIFLACVGGMTLKPLIRWLSQCHIPPALSAAVVLLLLVLGATIGFIQIGHPAVTWMNEAPQHMAELRQKAQKLFPRLARFSQAAAAVNDLGATEEEQKKPPLVELKTSRVPSFINWTGTFLAGLGESVVLLYLLLASGDLFLQKLVRVMPTFSDKKRAVDISHEIQQQISNYLFSVSVINIGLGIIVGGGLYWLGVPNAAMWGMLIALFNFVPYFGPAAGICLLVMVGLLTFDTVWKGLLPPAWYLLLHLLEANFITPVLLGRRFTLNPVVIFVSLIFWTWLWGVPGALLSVPILVSIKVICERIPSMSHVSELLTSESNSIFENLKLLRLGKIA
ncbi:MAG TPA: AI-2E family transporter [Candidatus Eisenbacteria bacterium]|nr:AI-2E family transporter [Candidatus Eisenbacteria bacterium]